MIIGVFERFEAHHDIKRLIDEDVGVDHRALDERTFSPPYVARACSTLGPSMSTPITLDAASTEDRGSVALAAGKV